MRLPTILPRRPPSLCLALLPLVLACAGAKPRQVPPPPAAPAAPAATVKPRATTETPKPPPKATKPRPPPAIPRKPGTLLARNSEYAVVVTGPGDTLRSLAARHLGDEGRAWLIADFNGVDRLEPGQEIVIPQTFENPTGVTVDGYQTVPILCYHRFAEKPAKMVVTPRAFAEQMEYLSQNGYRIVPMVDIADFLQGKRALPKRAVAITMDDGYKSAYQVAYPILKKYGFHATLYVYTDFIGVPEGLTWEQLSEMAASGLVDIQPHSKSHANLAQAMPGEAPEAYRRRITEEVEVPKRLLAEHLKIPIHTFAFPYGNANDLVVDLVQKADYQMAPTVLRGGNPFFAYPYLLRRTMVFGEDDLGAFRGKLDVFRSQRLR